MCTRSHSLRAPHLHERLAGDGRAAAADGARRLGLRVEGRLEGPRQQVVQRTQHGTQVVGHIRQLRDGRDADGLHGATAHTTPQQQQQQQVGSSSSGWAAAAAGGQQCWTPTDSALVVRMTTAPRTTRTHTSQTTMPRTCMTAATGSEAVSTWRSNASTTAGCCICMKRNCSVTHMPVSSSSAPQNSTSMTVMSSGRAPMLNSRLAQMPACASATVPQPCRQRV